MKRILVTGAGGYIGSYLCEFLAERGFHVIGSARSRIDEVKAALPKCEIISLDVMDPAIAALEIEADAVVHLATANDILSKNFMDGVALCAGGTKNVLELAKKNAIPRFVFFSTFQVYGRELTGRVTEDTPVHCENAYGLNHYFGERTVDLHAREENPGLRAAVIRPSNIYGRVISPTVNRWTLVPLCLCREAVEEKQIVLRSSGRQCRNFISLEALSEACLVVLQGMPVGFEVYNAAGRGFTIVEMAKKVAEIYRDRTGEELPLKVLSDEPAASNHFEVAIDKLRALGFKEPEEPSLEKEIHSIFDFLESGSTTT